jgi:DNA polymerase
VVTVIAAELADWRRAAHDLLARAVAPDAVSWLLPSAEAPCLPFPGHVLASRLQEPASPIAVPRAFGSLAADVSCYRHAGKWDVLYRLLWRLRHEGRHVLALASDDDVRRAADMAAAVRRDEHKMRAFVRFTPVNEDVGKRYVSWYAPDHAVVRRAAPFFADRFAGMRWSILTPDLSVHWDLETLSFSAGGPPPADAGAGEIEELWRTYYASIFNPARANLKATVREMPLRRWQRLPEATLITSLLSAAHGRTAQARAPRTASGARPFVPPDGDVAALRDAAQGCRGCPLSAPATQAVFGEGPPHARVMLVGEQPGNAEDLSGRPFVGPAGQVLDAALEAAGIERRTIYLTNAVKHFSFEPRGKRRIHQTPRMSEMRACRPWLEAELQRVRPSVLVLLGSTAARALLGPQARVMALRGRAIEGSSWAERVIVTVHPSAVLRSDDDGRRYFAMLVADLSLAAVGCATLRE